MRPQPFCASLLAAALIAAMAPLGALAQAPYPNQTIKIIVPNPPGGLPDTLSRIVGKRLQERIGEPVVIENRPGANSGIGTAAMTQAPADGYTLMMADGAILSISPLLYAKLPYNPKDVLPVAMVARAPLFLAINPQVPAKNLKELIDYARANPGKLNYGSIGIGSFHHLSMEAFNAAFGLKMNHIPYKGSSETIGAILGGHIDILFAAYAGLRPAAETRKVVILGSNGPKRSPQAPDVPAIAELSPGFDLAVIQGITTRVGTPKAAVDKIAAEMAAIVKEPDIISQFATAGIEPVGAGPEDYRAALDAEAQRMAKIAEQAGLKAQ
ncbi:Bug family tripartite tricarboxylate transporter substrate binding protein [Rhodoplanes sp. Z2-YC6860]|uniref:Bug family tripartite tricarboxylate transporter substrate binding protein n=1 Tax=Rhodoplanes sp. Z2-YC6860 TaxID=674703 RepID=UPI00078E6BEB|nr:tripartite tricarboxylate transporter substrate binding protein [Rhodoplanes sp. Z2-YC6860]AMN42703.1 ABC transporter substrate-binding protein [Rhodoplanes sp. Z2-YC6860]